jgi:hypothetical protein
MINLDVARGGAMRSINIWVIHSGHQYEHSQVYSQVSVGKVQLGWIYQ